MPPVKGTHQHIVKALSDDFAVMHTRPATHSQMHVCCPVSVAVTSTSWKFPSNESAAVHSIISTASLLGFEPGSCLMSYSCSSISQGVDLSFRGSCSSLEDHPAILLASCTQAGRGLKGAQCLARKRPMMHLAGPPTYSANQLQCGHHSNLCERLCPSRRSCSSLVDQIVCSEKASTGGAQLAARRSSHTRSPMHEHTQQQAGWPTKHSNIRDATASTATGWYFAHRTRRRQGH